jgi:hypothetical protein
MGREAKLRREKMKARILAEIGEWIRPGTPGEAELAGEIARLPTFLAKREPASRLAWAWMKPGECHTNCRWYEENDPSKKFKSVAGWWKQPHGIYTFHSVITDGEHYVCITPGPGPDKVVFEFSPDPNVERVIESDKHGTFQRRGLPVPKIVRTDPARTSRAAHIIMERLAAGMDPIKAGEIDLAEV